MSYVSWAIFCEGRSDELYLEIMVARLMEDIVAREGVRVVDIPQVPAIRLRLRGRGIDEVATEACDGRDAFDIVFIHGDTGGRALETRVAARSDTYCDRMSDLCAWPRERCVTITPRHETEAWILADPSAVLSALGYRGRRADMGLPADAREAERIADPKAVLGHAMARVSGPRRRGRAVEELFPAIATRQSFPALRTSRSFRAFEGRLRRGLADLGCVRASDD